MITELLPVGVGRVRSKITEANEPDGNGGWRKKNCRKAELGFDGEVVVLDFEHHVEAFEKLQENGHCKVQVRRTTKTFDGKTRTTYTLLEAQPIEPAARRAAA